MLKNISDYLSLGMLCFASVFSLIMFLRSFISEKDDETRVSYAELLRNYLNNEEE